MNVKAFRDYGANADVDDVLSGLGADEMDQVGTRVAGHGIECTYGCQTCGWQSKMLIQWPEVIAIVHGHKVAGVQALQQGVSVLAPCPRCNGRQPMFIGWGEIRDMCRDGVKANVLSPHQLPHGILGTY